MRGTTTIRRIVAVLAAGVVLVAVSGCQQSTMPTSPTDLPAAMQDQGLAKKGGIPAVIAVQERYTPGLMKKAGVVGTAVGLDDNDNLVVQVLLREEKDKAGVPSSLDGVPVVAEVTGEIVAMIGRTRPEASAARGTGVSHTAKQTPPIQLGTSGGWGYDLANGYCCAGTLGSLVQIGTAKYIMSNYHVFEADIVAGGNGRVATTGDPIAQPGLIDVGCNGSNAQSVATLVVKNSLPNSNVDVSIAQVASGMVRDDGAILEIGTISNQTVGASLRQAVKKSGRTSGLTRSTVSGLNATINVAYENECAGGAAFTKTFTGQIIVSNNGSKFLKAGDSGSLMVQDVTTKPKAVGLLFAGSSTVAVANPIGQVLAFLGATMVGN